jgi:glycosyltransferase involved in cell wall biosynthesis
VTLVSIIIPHFERPELLRETLDSVCAQTTPNWEVIVVDDGSSEDVYSRIKALSSEKIQIIQRQDGLKGPSRCRNLGIQTAKGDYVLFLDSDDLLAPHCIETRLHKAQQFPQNDLWAFPVELFRKTPGDLKQTWNDMEHGKFNDPLSRFLVSDSPWCVSSPLWRRESLRPLNGFNEAVMYGDDADLHIRALLSGIHYTQFPNVRADTFIRRADTPRITNTLSPQLLESRLKRLEEGSRALLNARVSPDLMNLWEGQYFVEGEFLLFNQPAPLTAIHRLIDLWRTMYPYSKHKIGLSCLYFRIASYSNPRLYIVTRISRRLMMKLAPKSWFPSRIPTTTSRRTPANV